MARRVIVVVPPGGAGTTSGAMNAAPAPVGARACDTCVDENCWELPDVCPSKRMTTAERNWRASHSLNHAAPVGADDARAIPVYIRGRGLQMIAKRVRACRAEAGMLTQVRWLSANADSIGDALEEAVT